MLVLAEIATRVIKPFVKPPNALSFDLVASKFLQMFLNFGPKFVPFQFLTPHPDDCELVGKMSVFCKIVDRWKELPLCEVAGRAENHHHARLGFSVLGHNLETQRE